MANFYLSPQIYTLAPLKGPPEEGFGECCILNKPIAVAELEAPSGFEPLHRGFADLSLSHLGTAP